MKWPLVTKLLMTFSVSVHAKELAHFHLLCALFQVLFLHFLLLLLLSSFPSVLLWNVPAPSLDVGVNLIIIGQWKRVQLSRLLSFCDSDI